MLRPLVERRVTKLGKYFAGERFSNEFQELTLDCGHVGKYMVDIAAWKVGDMCYCDQCSEIKNQAIKEVKQEIQEHLTKVF